MFAYIQQHLERVYKEGEGEYRTVYMLCVTAVRMVHDLCNDIKEVTLKCTSTHAHTLALL